MEEKELMVEIPIERYEQLLDIESRVFAAGELALHGVPEEVVYLAIGTMNLRAAVDKKKKEHEKFLASLREKENGD